MPDHFDRLAAWLLDRAMQDDDLGQTLSGLSERLINGGVPVARIVIGRTLLHPVIGIIDLSWNADSNQVTLNTISRNQVPIERMRKSPFGALVDFEGHMIRARLRDPDERARFDIFEQLHREGMTDYVAMGHFFGDPSSLIANATTDFRGAKIAYSTKRFSGFSDADIDGFERIRVPLALCARMATERLLATALLEAYLGRVSGKKVLTGQTARGDGEQIECILFYSDMRGSIELSQGLEMSALLETVNQYFDCTAGAVLDHGGEVLKFIGDGILAIFPIDEVSRPRAAMATAALSAAREAFARANEINELRDSSGLPQIDFGIALHAGEVIYGNVGTEKRLDFTATGPAVGKVSRCEALTRELPAKLVATTEFAALCGEDGKPFGKHELRGFNEPVDIVGFDPNP